MKKIGFILLGVIITLALGALILIPMLKDDDAPAISSSVLREKIMAVSELTSAKYYYTGVGSFKEQTNIYGLKIPFTESSFVISYDGVISAGIDMEKVQVDLFDKTIRITLPEAKILSHEIDETSIKVFDEKKSVFNPIGVGDYTAFRQDQKAYQEQAAITKGLLEESRKNAETAITGFLKIIPGIDESYTIQFTK